MPHGGGGRDVCCAVRGAGKLAPHVIEAKELAGDSEAARHVVPHPREIARPERRGMCGVVPAGGEEDGVGAVVRDVLGAVGAHTLARLLLCQRAVEEAALGPGGLYLRGDEQLLA